PRGRKLPPRQRNREPRNLPADGTELLERAGHRVPFSNVLLATAGDGGGLAVVIEQLNKNVAPSLGGLRADDAAGLAVGKIIGAVVGTSDHGEAAAHGLQ